MKKLLGILVLGLLLDGCGEPAEKIYPKNGMFPKTKPHYELICIVDAGPDQTAFELDLMIQENYVSLGRHESRLKFRTKEIIEDNDRVLTFTVDGDEDYYYYDKLAGIGEDFENKDRMYLLDRETGDFMIGIGEHGSCIEQHCRWKLNRDKNTINYVCDK
jgi:hypothetical protein